MKRMQVSMEQSRGAARIANAGAGAARLRARLALLLFAACTTVWAAPPDLEREARLRKEIEPNLVVGEAVDLRAGDTTFLGIYTPAANGAAPAASTAVVLVHGSGVHPDWGFIGKLRMDLADQGFATLSLQMPVRPAGAPPSEYAELMPHAAQRIAAGAAWLQARGHRDLVLVSHSLGSRMADAYFASRPSTPFRAWASLGITGGTYSSKRPPQLLLLDVYGAADYDDVVRLATQRAAALPPGPSRQVRIDGADHFYAGRENELLRELTRFFTR
jgi:alpha/beta superfamily hydrolase